MTTYNENQRLRERWRNALWLVTGLLIAGALLFAANWEADRRERVRMDFFRDRISDLARIAESLINRQLHEFDDSLLVLRDSYAADPERFAENIHLLRSGPLSDREVLVVLVDRDGYLAYTDTTDATDVKSHLYLGDRKYFRFFADGGKDLLYIDEPTFGRVTSRYSLPLARPIYDRQGHFLGVIGISVKQQSLVNFSPHLQLSENTTITIVNHGGAVVSRSRDLAKVQGTNLPPELIVTMLKGQEGVFLRRTDLDGAELVTAYQHIHNEETPLIVYVEASTGNVLREMSLQRTVLMWGAGFTSLVIMVLIVVYLKGQRITAQLIDTLRKSKKQEYETLTGTSLDGFYIADSSGRILDTNDTFLKMLGYTQKELLCLSVTDIEAAESPEQVAGHIYTAMDAGSTRMQSRLRRKDGTIIDVEISAQFVKESDMCFFVFVRDITERKQAGEALRQSEERYRTVANFTYDWEYWMSPDWHFIYCSPSCERITGYRAEEFEKDPDLLKTITHPDDRDQFVHHMDVVTCPGPESHEQEVRIVSRSGEVRWIAHACCIVRGRDGTFLGRRANNRDITVRKQAEEKIQRNESRLRRLVDILQHPSETIQGFLDYALDQAIQLTESKIGYIYYYHENRKEFVLNTWSKEVMPECAIASSPTCNELDKIGIWGEAVRQRRPIIVNDFQAANPLKKGYPEGHVQLRKFITIPIFKDDSIVGVIGLANKKNDYEEPDILQVSLLMEAVWKVTERKQAEEKIHELSQMLIQAQENERHLISCELHDSIAQNLSVLKINCDTIYNDPSMTSPAHREKLAASSSLLFQTIAAVRNLAYDLRLPGLDEMGLVKALEVYCEEASENGKVKVDFQSAGMAVIDLDGNMEIHIYRLIQEGLNNTRKHADADHATILLLGSSPNIILRIEDNGRGFDVKAQELLSAATKRMGIRSMQERVNLLHGQMTIQSQPMKGTKIFIKIPL